ncbi:MAG: hypothetical protein AAF639_18475 [Chloroflexota bacterium]
MESSSTVNKPSIPNPVTAIAEADATGEIADIFADIRHTMALPLITSVWRILVDVDDGLRPAWAATKPLYLSGQPQATLEKMQQRVNFPTPAPLTRSQLACVGVTQADLPVIKVIVNAYNRSNSLNLIALTALTSEPAGTPANHPIPQPPPHWLPLPQLLPQEEIDSDTWSILRRVYQLSSEAEKPTDKPGVATIWRHLAHWPGFMALALVGLTPLVENGTVALTMQAVHEFTQDEAASIAHLRGDRAAIPADAYNFIARYASGVHRIVTMGHIFAKWLDTTVEG